MFHKQRATHSTTHKEQRFSIWVFTSLFHACIQNEYAVYEQISRVSTSYAVSTVLVPSCRGACDTKTYQD